LDKQEKIGKIIQKLSNLKPLYFRTLWRYKNCIIIIIIIKSFKTIKYCIISGI